MFLIKLYMQFMNMQMWLNCWTENNCKTACDRRQASIGGKCKNINSCKKQAYKFAMLRASVWGWSFALLSLQVVDAASGAKLIFYGVYSSALNQTWVGCHTISWPT
jgi:hypothetical protein